jgi:hypothetical protein
MKFKKVLYRALSELSALGGYAIQKTRKRASDFFRHFEASSAPASTWIVFPLKLTFLAPLMGRSDGPAFFPGASATLLTC